MEVLGSMSNILKLAGMFLITSFFSKILSIRFTLSEGQALLMLQNHTNFLDYTTMCSTTACSMTNLHWISR